MTKLQQIAKNISQKAYAPYSNFAVGCALELMNGAIITGANIENASYGATLCAERVALAKYKMEQGHIKVKKIAIYNNGLKIIVPCGICLQVAKELLDSKTKIILFNNVKEKIMSINELFPYHFDKNHLNV